jgi:hypothetical protein
VIASASHLKEVDVNLFLRRHVEENEIRCKGRGIKATPANFRRKYDQCGSGIGVEQERRI